MVGGGPPNTAPEVCVAGLDVMTIVFKTKVVLPDPLKRIAARGNPGCVPVLLMGETLCPGQSDDLSVAYDRQHSSTQVQTEQPKAAARSPGTDQSLADRGNSGNESVGRAGRSRRRRPHRTRPRACARQEVADHDPADFASGHRPHRLGRPKQAASATSISRIAASTSPGSRYLHVSARTYDHHTPAGSDGKRIPQATVDRLVTLICCYWLRHLIEVPGARRDASGPGRAPVPPECGNTETGGCRLFLVTPSTAERDRGREPTRL